MSIHFENRTRKAFSIDITTHFCNNLCVPRKQNKSAFEAMVELAALMPWWIGCVIATVLFFLLHYVASQPVTAPSQPGQVEQMLNNVLIKGIASVGQFVLPLIVLCGAGVSVWRRHARQSLVNDVTQSAAASSLDDMSWHDFELLVGEFFRLQDYKVVENGGGGPDGGVDLILSKGNEIFLVQCKQWKAFKVGVDVVRELYGVMAAKGAIGGFVITSGHFSQDAVDFADGRNVTLIDGPMLHTMIRKAQTSTVHALTKSEPPSNAPVCPLCAKVMTKRTARRGLKAGKDFWGCSAFPACHGTRNLE